MTYPTKLLGLIGFPLEHSFSERYFNERFSQLGYDFVEYRNFPIEEIEDLPELLDLFPEICGFNVTSPYKQQIMRFLDEVSPEAEKVNAVNTVVVERSENGYKLKGFNTDIYGFEQSIRPLLKQDYERALILGTGGAAQAVAFVLGQLGIKCSFVSRSKKLSHPSYVYAELNKKVINEHKIIVNATPLGMYPKTSLYPPIPYEYITPEHLLFDLIYNPPITRFLELGLQRGASISNGLEMLYKQAQRAWEIFEQHGCLSKEI